MTTRRSFLQQLSVMTAAVLAAPLLPDTEAQSRAIGLQLYTIRDAMAKDPAGSLAHVARIGYNEVEAATYTGTEKFYGYEAKAYKQLLNQNHLQQISGHYILGGLEKTSRSPLGSIQNGWEKAIEDAHTVGQQYMVCAFLMPDERKTLDQYKKIADIFNRAGEQCKQAGIQFCYHNHNFEFEPIDGQIPYEVLLKSTDPNLVKMEMDIYWVKKAGQDPLKLFAKYPGRFVLWHVKDMDNTPKQFFTEVGHGIIDFKTIFAHARQAGMQHFFVEQDVCPGDPFVSITESYQYLHKLLG
ncbi:sugar phosphate isomerase/epimerase family protein [Thermoflavifilum thermophilum]|uniref:Tat (Twin-arginine translocation) pathway signal sequence n=1 Tax=Thermoflavifilum thermophilum TaxID=1393122 RepID=A0A1I7NDG0_9BACT|nr:sugar phosphate isomerase/epimerase [Thermoflavifilum thermophilum]SFV32725.1 Tat (twin-arginine translocation) pathway signal sequence [Thermoflavifilum thermophilum]